ncbi:MULTISPECIES: low molecular weight protein-tyrosine-phosphatase [unclassified Streptococcus]|uniref:low molecular weight protein-tyrosine-phosphatase n=1 Tax=unclassified Streptococcus TaxID=2608887 RepID=UPI00359E2659
MKVAFVCLGNICRSPMAEFVMKQLAQDHDHHLTVVSRATSSWEHGNPIHRGTQDTLNRYGVSYDTHKTSQQISLADLEDYDVVIGMDDQNVIDLKKLSAGRYDDKIFLFCDGGVPDPWYTGDFEETYHLVTRGCQSWLDRLKNN